MYFLIVEDPEIGRSLILVEGGTVCVIQADCPDKVCVHTGPISQEGEVIACLPHGVIIYIPRGEGSINEGRVSGIHAILSGKYYEKDVSMKCMRRKEIQLR